MWITFSYRIFELPCIASVKYGPQIEHHLESRSMMQPAVALVRFSLWSVPLKFQANLVTLIARLYAIQSHQQSGLETLRTSKLEVFQKLLRSWSAQDVKLEWPNVKPNSWAKILQLDLGHFPISKTDFDSNLKHQIIPTWPNRGEQNTNVFNDWAAKTCSLLQSAS